MDISYNRAPSLFEFLEKGPQGNIPDIPLDKAIVDDRIDEILFFKEGNAVNELDATIDVITNIFNDVPMNSYRPKVNVDTVTKQGKTFTDIVAKWFNNVDLKLFPMLRENLKIATADSGHPWLEAMVELESDPYEVRSELATLSVNNSVSTDNLVTKISERSITMFQSIANDWLSKFAMAGAGKSVDDFCPYRLSSDRWCYLNKLHCKTNVKIQFKTCHGEIITDSHLFTLKGYLDKLYGIYKTSELSASNTIKLEPDIVEFIFMMSDSNNLIDMFDAIRSVGNLKLDIDDYKVSLHKFHSQVDNSIVYTELMPKAYYLHTDKVYLITEEIEQEISNDQKVQC